MQLIAMQQTFEFAVWKNLCKLFYKCGKAAKQIIQRELLAAAADLSHQQAAPIIIEKFTNRYQDIKTMRQLPWQVPLAITGSAINHRCYNSLAAAITALPQVQQDYQQTLSNYIKGNLIIRSEIGYNLVNNQPIFNIHFHAMVELNEYEQFLAATRPLGWRVGAKAEWIFHTERISRKWAGQTTKNYILREALYFTKFAIRAGSGQGRHRDFLPPDKSFQQINCRLYIQTDKKIRINNRIKQLNNWLNLKKILSRVKPVGHKFLHLLAFRRIIQRPKTIKSSMESAPLPKPKAINDS